MTIDVTKQYQWNEAFNPAVDIQEVVVELDKIYKDNQKITPALLVEEARNENSVLHSFFEWDDSVAAESYRRSQAAHLLRNIEVKVVKDGNPLNIRVYETISRPEDNFTGESNYKRFDLMDGEDIEATKAIILKDLHRIKNRLSKFDSLKSSVKFIDKAITVLSKKSTETAEIKPALQATG